MLVIDAHLDLSYNALNWNRDLRLPGRGYSEADIEGVMHGNWLRFFNTAWS